MQEDLTSSRRAHGDLTRPNKAKYKVLNVVWSSLQYQHKLRNEQSQRSLPEKDLRDTGG